MAKSFRQIRRAVGLVLALALIVVLAGCGKGSNAPATGTSSSGSTQTTTSGSSDSNQPAAPQSKDLRVGLDSKLETLDPHFSIQWSERYILYTLYNSLVGLNEDFNIVPELAKSWDTPDSTTYVLHLVQGVKFHDGTDFNAEAVKANFDFILDEANNSPHRKLLAGVAGVEVVDTYTIKITLNEPDPGLLAVLAERPGMMVSPAARQQYGEQLGQHPVGTGPFVFKAWPSPDVIEVAQNESYWQDEKPHLDSITFSSIPDTTVRITKLRAGELDIIDGLTGPDAKALERVDGIQLAEHKSLSFYELAFNTSQKPWNNEKLRQAIAWALDREEIQQLIFLGSGRPGHGPLAGGWAYNPDLKKPGYDVEKAKQLLKEAGYPDGFTFEVSISAQPLYVNLAEVVQAQLAKANITANIVQIDPTKHYSMQVQGEINAFLTRWTPRADPGVIMKMHYHSQGYANNQRWSDPQVDQWIDTATTNYDLAIRKEALQKAEQRAVEAAAIIFVHHPSAWAAMNNKVKGFVWVPDMIMRVRDLDLQ